MKKLNNVISLTLAIFMAATTGVYAKDTATTYKTIAENLPYNYAEPNNDGFIYVSDDKNSGYINNDGEIVIKPQEFKNISGYSKGYFLGKYNDGSFILYDNKGNVLMSKEKFAKAAKGGYSPNDLLIAYNFVVMNNTVTNDPKIVDFNGDTLNDMTNLFTANRTNFLQNNLIHASSSNGIGSYYLDTKGKPVLQDEKGYSYMDVSEDAILKVKLSSKNLSSDNDIVTPVAFYDTKGKLIFNVPEAAQAPNKSVDFISGPGPSTSLMQFFEGYATYQDKITKLYGFLDKTGKIAIPAKFSDYLWPFSNGIAGVALPNDDKISYIDTKGNVLFSVPKPNVYPYRGSNGMVVNLYVNYANQSVEPAKLVVNDLNGNQIFLSNTIFDKNGDPTQCSYVFGSGKPVLSKTIVGAEVDPYTNFVIMETKDKHYGAYDLKGNEILQPIYDNIQTLNTLDKRLILIKDSKLSIVQVNERVQPAKVQSTSTQSVAPKSLAVTPEYSCKAIYNNDGLTDDYTYKFADGSMDVSPNDCLVMINGQFVSLKGIIQNGTTFVPIRVISESFGSKVNWEGKINQVSISDSSSKIIMNIGKEKAFINGTEKTLDFAPFIKNGSTYVPLRFISETMGKSVGYLPAFKAKDYPCNNLLAYHAVVWVDEPALMNNADQTIEQVTKWLKDQLNKDTKIKQPNGNNEVFDQKNIDSTSYIGQVGRYTFFQSTYPILVDMKNNSFYIVNLQNAMGSIYKEDPSIQMTAVTESQAKELIKNLIPKAAVFYSQVFNGADYFKVDKNVTIPENKNYAFVVDDNIKSVSDLKAWVGQVLTPQVAEARFFKNYLHDLNVPLSSFDPNNYTPLYYDYNGKLYADTSNGGHGFSFDWLYDTIKITNITEDTITATINRTLFGQYDETSTIKLERINGNWLIANDFVDKTDSDILDASQILSELQDKCNNVFFGTIGGQEVCITIHREGYSLKASYINKNSENELTFDGYIDDNKIILNRLSERQQIVLYMDKTDNLFGELTSDLSGDKSISLKLSYGTFSKLENRYGENGSNQEVELFTSNLKKMVVTGDKTSISKCVAYPIEVLINSKKTVINNQIEFIESYDKIIDAKFTTALSNMYTKFMFNNYLGIYFTNGNYGFVINKVSGKLNITAIVQ